MIDDWSFEILDKPKKPLKEWSKKELWFELSGMARRKEELEQELDEVKEWGKIVAEEYNNRPKEDWEYWEKQEEE